MIIFFVFGILLSVYSVGLRSFTIQAEEVPFRFKKPDKIEPIVIFHGVCACSLERKLHHVHEPLFYCFSNIDWTLLWINVIDIIPHLSSPCFQYNLQVHWNNVTKEYSNNPGVSMRVKDFGGTEGIEYLNNIIKKEGEYFHPFVEYFAKAGYVRGKSIRGALLDWRLGPNEWIRGGTYERIKKLIEETYEINGETKVHLVGHSLGGPSASLFLSHFVNQEWKDKYISSYFSLGGSFDGGYEALADTIKGNYDPLPVKLTGMTTSAGGLSWSIPYWHYQDDIVIYTPQRNYTLSQIGEVFNDVGRPEGNDLYHYTHEMDPSVPPNVTTHCFKGIGFKTPKAFYFKELKMGSDYDIVDYFEDGDCTVFPESYGVCDGYEGRQKASVDVHTFTGKHFTKKQNLDYHRYMPSDPEVLERIYELIYGPQKKED